MPIVLPTAPFDPAKTIFGSKVIAVFTPTSGTAFNIPAKVGDYIYKSTEVMRKVPDSQGINRPDRVDISEAEERLELVDLEEVDDVIANMGGFAVKNKQGTVVIWVLDQDDPTGTSVRLKSDSFPCSIKVKDGTTKFGGGDHSKVSLSLLSLKAGAIVWTPNATA